MYFLITFNFTASGYARSDGVVVLYIQQACDAKRSYATIVNVKTKYNGNQSAGYLDKSSLNMTNFINEFYAECEVNPEDVEFVEGYGCANKVRLLTYLKSIILFYTLFLSSIYRYLRIYLINGINDKPFAPTILI